MTLLSASKFIGYYYFLAFAEEGETNEQMNYFHNIMENAQESVKLSKRFDGVLNVLGRPCDPTHFLSPHSQAAEAIWPSMAPRLRHLNDRHVALTISRADPHLQWPSPLLLELFRLSMV